jgi:excisionase family DNA binding protein
MNTTQHREALLTSTASLAPAADPSKFIRAAYSIDEVAVSVGVGRDAIYKAIRDKRLQAKKIGPRRTIITADALHRYLESLPDLQLGEEG